MPSMTYVLMNSDIKPITWYEALIVIIIFGVIIGLTIYLAERWINK